MSEEQKSWYMRYTEARREVQNASRLTVVESLHLKAIGFAWGHETASNVVRTDSLDFGYAYGVHVAQGIGSTGYESIPHAYEKWLQGEAF